MFLIPAACLLLIFSLNRYGKFRVWEGSLAAMCFVCVFWGGSGTGIVTAGAALILLLVFLPFRPNIPLFLGVMSLLYLLSVAYTHLDVYKRQGLRGSNPPPPPWQGGALPNELNPQIMKY